MRAQSASLLLALVAGIVPLTALAQSQGQNGYGAVLLDGQNDLGEHFAVATTGDADAARGFLYLADERALYAGRCSTQCQPEVRLTEGEDRGQYVSAAARPLLPGARPIAAFYNATRGALEVVDCFDASCSFATTRTLDDVNDVGQGTAIAVDPATGLPHIAYYDASNGDLRLFRCSVDTCASGDSVLVDGDGDRGRNPAILIHSGVMTLAYDDSSTGQLRVATATAPYATFTRTSAGAGSDAVLVHSGGTVDVIYSGPLQTLERRRCGLADCSLLIAPGALNAIAGTGVAPAATVMPNGMLFVTHGDAISGDRLGTVCNDLLCSAPLRLVLDTGPGLEQTSVAMTFADGRPLAVYRDAPGRVLRSSQCTTLACTGFVRRIAGNGLVVSSPDLALRDDGRVVAIWTRLRLPRIGLCDDLVCSSVQYRTPEAANSDSSRPSIVVRPDRRPFAFYSYLGGNTAWDCADAECSTGTRRDVAGTGNATSDVTELALRPDGRPLLLYYRRTTNEVFVFSCADVDCSTGTERRVAMEPTSSNTRLSGFSLAVGSDNLARIAYNVSFQPMPGQFAGIQRLLRCDDVECTSASARDINAEQGFFAIPLALRADDHPVLVENTNAGRNLVVCSDIDCLAMTRTALPNPFDLIGPLRLDAEDRPFMGSGSSGSGGFWRCADAACAGIERVVTISDAGSPNRGFSGRMQLSDGASPVLVFAEQDLGDVWLSLPVPTAVFADGFEP